MLGTRSSFFFFSVKEVLFLRDDEHDETLRVSLRFRSRFSFFCSRRSYKKKEKEKKRKKKELDRILIIIDSIVVLTALLLYNKIL